MDTEIQYAEETYVEDLIEAKIETAVIKFEYAEYYLLSKEVEE
jgi:hypothetical protein